MNKELTEIIFVLDRSGSMASMRAEAIGGFNAFVEKQRLEPGRTNISLILFDHEYEPQVGPIPIAEMPPITEREFQPRGTTALLDAMGRSIDDLGKRLAALPDSERPGHVLVVILTDGLENASQDYTVADVAGRIRHQQEKYNWEFLFLAGDLQAIEQAQKLNIDASSTVHYAKTKQGMMTSFDLASAQVSERRKRRRGE